MYIIIYFYSYINVVCSFFVEFLFNKFFLYNLKNGCINNFITQYVDYPQYAYIVTYLCYFRDYADPFVLTSTEIVQLI